MVPDKVTVVEGDGSGTGNVRCGAVFAGIIVIPKSYPRARECVKGLRINGILGDILCFGILNGHFRAGVVDVDDSASCSSVGERAVTYVHGCAVEQGNTSAVSGSLIVTEIAVIQSEFLGSIVETDGRGIGCTVSASEFDVLNGDVGVILRP